MSAIATPVLQQAYAAPLGAPSRSVPPDVLPEGIRAVRGIIIGGALSCAIWAGIIAAVLAVV